MKLFKIESIQSPITKKLLIAVFSIYLTVTLAVTLFHMTVEYRFTQQSVKATLGRFEQIVKKSVLVALEENDLEEAKLLLVGVVNSKAVRGVKLSTTRKGRPSVWQVGLVEGEQGGTLEIDPTTRAVRDKKGFLEKLITHSFTVQYQSPDQRWVEIGEISFYTPYRAIWDRLKMGFIILLANELLKAAVLWFFFLRAGARYLSRPLRLLTCAIQNISAGELSAAPTLTSLDNKEFQGTEIETLSTSFTRMVDNLQETRATLFQTRKRLEGTIQAMPSIMIGVTKEGIVTDWNDRAAHLSRIPMDKACGFPLRELYPPFAKHADLIEAAMVDGQVKERFRVEESSLEAPFFFDVTVYPVVVGSYAGAVVRIDDVTLRVKMDKLMIQTEKMSSLGLLAAGVAHEINNPLGAVIQSVQNINRRLDSALPANQQVAAGLGVALEPIIAYVRLRKIMEFLDGIRQAGERAAHIVSNLLQFSRKSNGVKIPVSLVDLVENAIELAATDQALQEKARFSEITFVKNYEKDLPPLFCCVIEIEQVIFNLLKNAAQAMAGAFSEDRKEKKAEIRIAILKKEGSLHLTIEDNGPGMDEVVKERLFEPFFTTKPVGEGTGLGLSVSYGIVENHGGSIEVESVVGQGTKFIIALPLTGEKQNSTA